jgi:DeoR/GlpR family transcriptional regulator of sugar metabolism
VLSPGGRVRGQALGAVDQWAVRMLEDLVLDLAVLDTNGITVAHGLTCPDAAVAAVKRRADRGTTESQLRPLRRLGVEVVQA